MFVTGYYFINKNRCIFYNSASPFKPSFDTCVQHKLYPSNHSHFFPSSSLSSVRNFPANKCFYANIMCQLQTTLGWSRYYSYRFVYYFISYVNKVPLLHLIFPIKLWYGYYSWRKIGSEAVIQQLKTWSVSPGQPIPNTVCIPLKPHCLSLRHRRVYLPVSGTV